MQRSHVPGVTLLQLPVIASGLDALGPVQTTTGRSVILLI
jgi:hypothetical protein